MSVSSSRKQGWSNLLSLMGVTEMKSERGWAHPEDTSGAGSSLQGGETWAESRWRALSHSPTPYHCSGYFQILVCSWAQITAVLPNSSVCRPQSGPQAHTSGLSFFKGRLPTGCPNDWGQLSPSRAIPEHRGNQRPPAVGPGGTRQITWGHSPWPVPGGRPSRHERIFHFWKWNFPFSRWVGVLTESSQTSALWGLTELCHIYTTLVLYSYLIIFFELILNVTLKKKNLSLS